MVFAALQITEFFEDGAQMGLSNRTRVYLQGEGITHPDDLIEFVKKEAGDQVLENCKRPPQVANAAGALVNQQHFLLPERSLLRLKTAALVVEDYCSRSRSLRMNWSHFRVPQSEKYGCKTWPPSEREKERPPRTDDGSFC